MGIPVEFLGRAAGIQKGGKLQVKMQKILVKALPKNMPEKITIDITSMELGDTIKVKDVVAENFELLNNPRVTIAAVTIPRLARTAEEEELKAEEMAEGEEGTVPSAESESGEGASSEVKNE